MVANPASPDNPLSGLQDTFPAAVKDDLVQINWLRQMFDDSRSITADNRRLAETWRDYYDGPGQLKSEVRRVMQRRKQPPIWTNRVQPAIDGMLGILEGTKVDPRALPRNPTDQDTADVATKALRYVADSSNFQQTKLNVAENFFIEGTGAAIIEWDGQKTVASQIRWEEFFYDPYSRRNDFKDARYLGSAKWMDLAVVQQLYPDAKASLGDLLTPAGLGIDSTWQDRPDNAATGWVDRRRQRLMVVELYYNNGQGWHRYLYCGAGILEEGPSAYIDPRTKQTRCPIEAESCYVDRNNGRYGRILNMVPLQDEINAWRSRSLHLANSRQVQQADPAAAPVDSKTARDEAARADGVIPPGWQIVPTADLFSSAILIMNEGKGEIERMGPTPAVLGQQGNASQSGRARQILQQAGMTELARPMGRIEDWEERCYKQMWLNSQQFQQAPWWIRVTDDPKSPEFLQINEPVFDDMGQPVLAVDPRTGQPVMQPVMGPEGPVIDPNTGQPAMQPVQEVRNRIAEMDMDIIIDSTPDTASLAQEVWADLMELAKVYPIDSPQFLMAVQVSPMPNKREIIEQFEGIKAKQAQDQSNPEQDAIQQQAVMLELQEKAADIENTAADTEKKQADTAKTYFEMGRDSAGQEPSEPANMGGEE